LLAEWWKSLIFAAETEAETVNWQGNNAKEGKEITPKKTRK